MIKRDSSDISGGRFSPKGKKIQRKPVTGGNDAVINTQKKKGCCKWKWLKKER